MEEARRVAAEIRSKGAQAAMRLTANALAEAAQLREEVLRRTQETCATHSLVNHSFFTSHQAERAAAHRQSRTEAECARLRQRAQAEASEIRREAAAEAAL